MTFYYPTVEDLDGDDVAALWALEVDARHRVAAATVADAAGGTSIPRTDPRQP